MYTVQSDSENSENNSENSSVCNEWGHL